MWLFEVLTFEIELWYLKRYLNIAFLVCKVRSIFVDHFQVLLQKKTKIKDLKKWRLVFRHLLIKWICLFLRPEKFNLYQGPVGTGKNAYDPNIQEYIDRYPLVLALVSNTFT